MPTASEIKANNNTLIREKTEPNSIPTDVVADQLDALVDYTDQQSPAKTSGAVEANNVSLYPELVYDLNTVSTSGASDKVVLPSTLVIGKEILVFALNNANAFAVRGNQEGTSVLSPNGVANFSTNVSVAANISYRFIHLGSGYWKAELL